MLGGERGRKATAVSPLNVTLRVMTWLRDDSLRAIHPADQVELFINLSLRDKGPNLGSFTVPVADGLLEAFLG